MLAESTFSTAVVMTNGAALVEHADLAAAGYAPATPDAAPAQAPQERHRQSQKQLAQLNAAAKMLAGLDGADASFQAAMVRAGLIEGCLAEWRARYAAAVQAIETRHQAMVEALAATEAMRVAEYQARAAYSAFRQVARTLVTSHSGQAALKLDEYPPAHREAFLRVAEVVLATARGEPYATLLGAATFGPERMTATLAALDALTAATAAQDAAQHRARQATAARDVAMRDLTTAARQMRVEVKTLLRCNPQLMPPVGF